MWNFLVLKGITAAVGVVLLAACCGAALAADLSPSQIYRVATTGHMAGAQRMIAQVLRDHPNSGNAHWVAAELDARAGDYALAGQELHTAQSLKPGLPFANPRSVRELERQLGMPQTSLAGHPGRAAHSSRFGFLLILIVAALVVWMILRRRAALGGNPSGISDSGAWDEAGSGGSFDDGGMSGGDDGKWS